MIGIMKEIFLLSKKENWLSGLEKRIDLQSVRFFRFSSLSRALTKMEHNPASLILLHSTDIKETKLFAGLIRGNLDKNSKVLVFHQKGDDFKPEYPPGFRGWIEYLFLPVSESFLKRKVEDYLQVFSQAGIDESLSRIQLEREKEELKKSSLEDYKKYAKS